MAIRQVFVRHQYNYDMDEASDETGLKCEDQSLAVQSQAEEADINTIVRRFGLTGQLPQNVRVPTYADFEDVFDFQTAMNAIRTAEESFMAMPAEVRARFHNDAQEFLEFCDMRNDDGKPKNYDEMVKLGLLVSQESDTIIHKSDGPAKAKEKGDDRRKSKGRAPAGAASADASEGDPDSE